MQIAEKEGFKMAIETKCPICQKLLIGGQCPDCGYYVDTHKLASDINDLDVNAGHLCESHNGETKSSGSKFKTYSSAGSYSNRAGHLCESHNGETTFDMSKFVKERDAEDMSKSDQQIASERSLFILGVILTVVMGFWGYIISTIILKSKKANPKYQKKLTKLFIAIIIFYVVIYGGMAILPAFTG